MTSVRSSVRHEGGSALPPLVRNGQPLLSFILPTYQRCEYLNRSLRALVNEVEHNYPNAEIIVADGGSTDGTVDLLKSLDSKLTYWVSERDSGVNEAANKALARAKGEFIYGIGDDDELVPGGASAMAKYLIEHPEVDVVSGQQLFFRQHADGRIEEMESATLPLGRWPAERFFAPDKWGWMVPEQQLVRRRVFEKFGTWDDRYRNFAYVATACRRAKGGAIFDQVPEVVVKRYMTPKGTTTNLRKVDVHLEMFRLLLKNAGPYWACRWLVMPCARRIKPAAIKYWYQTLRVTRPLRHPVKALRGQ